MKNILALVLIIAVSSPSYSQIEENSKKNSIGLDYRFGSYNTNIGVTYRRHLKSSKYSFKGSLNLGSQDNSVPYRFAGRGNFLIYETGDTSIPLIGVGNSFSYSNFQNIELGLERDINLWKFNFIGGIDLTLGHRFSHNEQRVEEMELLTQEQNGITYSYYGTKQTDSLTNNASGLNSLNSRRNHLTVGVNTRFGFKFRVSQRLFATAFVGIGLEYQTVVSQNYSHSTNTFKEHLPTPTVVTQDVIYFNTFSSIGLNYRF